MKRITLAPLLALALFAAGCGDDDEDGGGGSVEITVSGSGKNLSYEVTEQVEAGAVEITLNNESKEEVDGQLAYTEDERSDEEVAAEFAKAVRGQPVADFFRAGGGAPETAPGESSEVTLLMKPGTYYVLPGDDAPKSAQLAKITVTGDDPEELEGGDGTVTASEYAFQSEGLPSGEVEIKLDNAGAQWHHFLASQLKESATIEDATRFLETEKGPSPFTEGEDSENGIETPVMDGGFAQIVQADLKPGRYAFFCFIPDREGGPPHVAKGMVSEVTVE